jgi:ribonuclease R
MAKTRRDSKSSKGIQSLVTSSAAGRGFLGKSKSQPTASPSSGRKFKSYKDLMAFDPEQSPKPAQANQPSTKSSGEARRHRDDGFEHKRPKHDPKNQPKHEPKSFKKSKKKSVKKSAPPPVKQKPMREGRRAPAPQGKNERLEGIIKRHPDGFGFLIPNDINHPDVYISRQYMTGIMTNDRVEVETFKSREDDRYFGEILKVISRANTRVVGKFLPVDQRYGVILDDGKGWGSDLRIPMGQSKGAKEGDMVLVEITTYANRQQDFTGRVVEILGDFDNPINDVLRVVHMHHIPNEFSKQAVSEARSYGGQVTDAEIQGRVDLRGLDLITIDGATARDFDDAIYVETDKNGFHLWIAIADVSHYVKPGTQLDDEAYERGTSTYFPNYVVPMLPEELSNELCSLNPHVPRLCFVCEMTINYQGEITSHKFYEAVMESKARVTYGEAQEVIDGTVPDKLKHVKEAILRAADLAKILMSRRFAEGSLDLEIPETQVVVDATGNSVDIIKSERLFAHRLIEELMLAANISVAKFIDENNIPGLYRIHEPPFEENLQTLERFLHNFGGTASMSGGKLQKKITKSLQGFTGRPEAQILNILTLRSMNQAKYSSHNLGHFGLGFSHYAHFTSPIRRYPDLIVHRLTKSILDPKDRRFAMSEEQLATAGTVLSAHEQRSTKAERQLISIKKARFMKQFVGQEFDGIISSVAKFGVFVLLRAFDVDGLVKVDQLGNDLFIFDDENLCLRGKRSGLTYEIGQLLKVQVAAVDVEAGRIDFVLTDTRESDGSDSHSEENRDNVQKRSEAQNHSSRVRKERVSKRRRKN